MITTPVGTVPSSTSASQSDEHVIFQLPNDVWFIIFKGFQAHELAVLCRVSKKCNLICKDSLLWERLLFIDFAFVAYGQKR